MGFKFNPFTGTFDIDNDSGGGGGGTPLTAEEVQDYVGAMVSGNTENLISVSYEDGDGTIDFSVESDLSLYDNSTSLFFDSHTDVDHDQTTNFLSDEHYGHSTINIDSGAGLTGGGDITSTRTLALDIDGQTAGTVASGDLLIIADIDDSNNFKKITAQSIADLGGGGGLSTEEVQDIVGAMTTGNTENLISVSYIDLDGTLDFSVESDLSLYDNSTSLFFDSHTDVDHDATTNFLSDEHYGHSTINIDTGAGLTGGGDITTTRTLAINITAEAAVAAVADDELLIADTSDTAAIKKITIQSILDLFTDTDTNLTSEEVQDIVGAMVSGNTENLISVTYDDAGNSLDFSVTSDLSQYDNSTSLFFDAHTDVDHDSTTNFLADEHYGHSTINIDTGSGLSGGGDITSTRTLAIDIGSETLVTAAVGDHLLIEDASDTNAIKKVTVQTIVDLAGGGGSSLTDEEVQDIVGAMVSGNTEDLISVTYSDVDNNLDFSVESDLSLYNNATSGFYDADADVDHDATTNFLADEHYGHSTINIDSGAGLSGGGNITSTRTLAVDINSETSVSAATGDEILIGDVSDSNAIKKVTAQSIADLASLAAEFDSAESEGASTTTSSTPSTKLTLSADVISGNKYRLSWYCEAVDTSTAGTTFVEIYANGTLIAENGEESTDVNDIKPYTGFYHYTAGATATQDFKIDYSNIGSGTSTIQRARLTIKRVA